MKRVESFLRELDRQWEWKAEAKVSLHIIGSTALMLQTRWQRGTKDGDVLETSYLDSSTQARLIQIGGPKTPLYEQHRMYIQVVHHAIPFLPQQPNWISQFSTEHFDIYALSVVDVVVSKLKVFRAQDLEDIDAMVSESAVPHQTLLARFRAAVDSWSGEARAEELPNIVANLHQVERDIFGVEETEIELPSWV